MDPAIQATSDDAIRAKDAAVRAGYYRDPFVSAFRRSSSSWSSSSSSARCATGTTVQPIIKRGTHARVACMDRAIASFLQLVQSSSSSKSTSCSCQIVVLGAGKDTTYFRLASGLLLTDVGDINTSVQSDRDGAKSASTSFHPSKCTIRWFDVDHDVVLREKVALIERDKEIFQSRVVRKDENCYEVVRTEERQLPSASKTVHYIYHLMSFDLRDNVKQLQTHLVKHGFDSSSPTLFVSECLQMYLPEQSTATLLEGLPGMVPRNACIVMYEPILGTDAFGRVMESNLLAARVVHDDSCLLQTRTLSQHLSKLSQAGFLIGAGCDMWSAYETVLTPEQRQRANACEFLDEVEEWILIMRHYCFAVATNNEESLGVSLCSVGATSSLGLLPGRCEVFSPSRAIRHS